MGYIQIMDLKKWRNKHGYSQASLAKTLGIHKMTISKWERGERKIPALLQWALKGLEKSAGKKGGENRRSKKMVKPKKGGEIKNGKYL